MVKKTFRKEKISCCEASVSNKEHSGKTKELLEELIRAGKVTKEEGERFLKKFWKDTEDEREFLKDKVGKFATEVRERMEAPTREEFKDIKKRVEKLEKEK